MEAMKMKKLPLSSNQKYFIIRTKGAPKAIAYAEAYKNISLHIMLRTKEKNEFITLLLIS